MMECLASQRAGIHYCKIGFQLVTILMVVYHVNLSLRDSDKLTFENRVRESINFVENNHPGYRMFMIKSIGMDDVNCTKNQISNLRDFAPLYVLCNAQWGVLVAVLLLLNSRSGCFLSIWHAVNCALLTNLNSLKKPFMMFVTWYYQNGTPYYKSPSPCRPKKEFLESELHIDKSDAFSEEFLIKQVPFKCDIMYNYVQLGVSVILLVLITLQKSADYYHFKLTVGPRVMPKSKVE